MENKTRGVPAGISEYIRQNFREDYLTEIKVVKNQNDVPFYFVDVTHEGNVYHLKFNGNGSLIQKEIETVRYPDDDVELGNVD